jgi:hypothetical protein
VLTRQLGARLSDLSQAVRRDPVESPEKGRTTVQYTLLIYGDPAAGPDQDSPEGQAEFAAWMTYTQALTDAGVLRGGEALQPTSTATSVQQRDGETLTTDGPFAETKEILGGFYLIDVPDLDTALAWAARMPNIAHGTVEVRPVMVFDRV